MVIERRLSFSAEEYEARRSRLTAQMDRQGLDLLLVTHFPNVCYLSGLQSFNCADFALLILPRQGDASIVSFDSELANARLTTWVADERIHASATDPVAPAIAVLQGYSLAGLRAGLELDALMAGHYARLTAAFPEAEFVDAAGLVQALRGIKSAEELAVMRRAATITSGGMQAAIDAARVGIRDTHVAAAAYAALVGAGSEFMAIQPVVCAGPMAGIRHGSHRRLPICDGDTILLEVSGCVDRYHAPMMRSVTLGRPNATVQRMADACRNTLNQVIVAMQPGRTFHDVAKIGEAAIAPAGPDMVFHHCFGYSVGLGFPPTWADSPLAITLGNETVLQPGMAFHLPISLRDEGRYGTAFGETVVITERGNEVLTHVERVLFER